MAYQALYRKWRPRTFDEMAGQDAVVTTLKNQLRLGRIGHAYLFCGTRGTGKTSAAKIMAKAVNCPHAAENGGNPCCSCPTCVGIDTSSYMNVIEIDAASNNGVDNIRDIREEVEYPPITGKYKVYIIDEVHMLSQGAFNALLKTLEEPPAYVIFILATTDPQKLPATILSRCQRFDFRRIPRKTIEGHLADICGSEGAEVSEGALRYIAESADGSMRDALSLLDQCLSYHPDGLSYEDVLGIVGASDQSSYSSLYRDIVASDIESAVTKLGELIDSGADIMRIINDMIMYLRNVLLAGSLRSEAREILDISGDRLQRASEDAALTDRETLIEILSAFAELPGQLRYSSGKRVLTEMLLVKLCTRKASGDEAALRGGSQAGSRAKIGEKSLKAAAGAQAKTASDPAPWEAAPDPAPWEAASDPSCTAPRRAPGAAEREDKNASEEPLYTAPKEGEADIDTLRANWQALVGGMHPSNRPLFAEALLKEENGQTVIVFKNKINFRLASENKEENGVIKLRELGGKLLGHELKLMARPARSGEIVSVSGRVTDEDLKKINFPVEIED